MFNNLFYLLETYTINCAKDDGTKCLINPPIPANIDLVLTDIITDPNAPDSVTELTLSSDLAMFFAYLLRFIVFHGLGLLLCWICTMSFRPSFRR